MRATPRPSHARTAADRRGPRAVRRLVPLLALLLLAPAAPGAAADGFEVRDDVAAVGTPDAEVRFEGAGWGHSVGMSQYGAYARARAGQSAYDILTAYYPGTSLPDLDRHEDIRVGLRQGRDQVDITSAAEVVWKHCAAEGGCPTLDEQPADETWYVCADDEATTVQRDDCETDEPDEVAEIAADDHLRINHGTDGPGMIATTDDRRGNDRAEYWRGQHRIYRGDDGLATVQRFSDVEDYLHGIAEVPDSWGDYGGQAAIQAQAITARGYALRRVGNPRDLGAGCFCHLLDSTSDQVYRGTDRGDNWMDAVASTEGKALTYDGRLAQTFYSSSNGGRSENVADVWGNPVPYLTSVDDPYSLADVNPYRSWTAITDNARVADALSDDLATVESLRIDGRTDGGTPRRIAYRGRDDDGEEVTGTFSGSVSAGVTLRTRLSSGVDVTRADGSSGVNSLPSSQVDRVGLEPFRDDDGAQHEYAIAWASEAGVARGRTTASFAPHEPVTRAQMASFVFRTFDVPASSADQFDDVDPRSEHGAAVNALADAGVVAGYGDGRFGPDEPVSREQMATFLVGAMGLDEVEDDGRFTDVDPEGEHTGRIHAIADAGVTQGCAEDRYCPGEPVARGQMATFLHRAVEDGR